MLAVEEPEAGRLGEVVSSPSPILVDDVRLFEEVVVQVMEGGLRVLPPHRNAAQHRIGAHLDEQFVEGLAIIAALQHRIESALY